MLAGLTFNPFLVDTYPIPLPLVSSVQHMYFIHLEESFSVNSWFPTCPNVSSLFLVFSFYYWTLLTLGDASPSCTHRLNIINIYAVNSSSFRLFNFSNFGLDDICYLWYMDWNNIQMMKCNCYESCEGYIDIRYKIYVYLLNFN